MLSRECLRTWRVPAGLLALGVVLLGSSHASAAIVTRAIFRADDPNIEQGGGTVTLLPNQGPGGANDALAAAGTGPTLTTATINGGNVPVLSFNGTQKLVTDGTFQPNPTNNVAGRSGAMFLVVNANESVNSDSSYLVGWNESGNGNGIGIVPRSDFLNPPDNSVSEMRVFAGLSGNPFTISTGINNPVTSGFEILAISWGFGVEEADNFRLDRMDANGNITSYDGSGFGTSSGITSGVVDALHIGSAFGEAATFSGNLAELRIYQATAGLDISATFREGIMNDLYQDWFVPVNVPEPASTAMLAIGSIGLVAFRRRFKK